MLERRWATSGSRMGSSTASHPSPTDVVSEVSEYALVIDIHNSSSSGNVSLYAVDYTNGTIVKSSGGVSGWPGGAVQPAIEATPRHGILGIADAANSNQVARIDDPLGWRPPCTRRIRRARFQVGHDPRERRDPSDHQRAWSGKPRLCSAPGSSVWGHGATAQEGAGFLAQRGSAPSTGISRNLRGHRSEQTPRWHGRSGFAGVYQRSGAVFLNASVGFGGSCFKKDILNLGLPLSSTSTARGGRVLGERRSNMNDYQRMRFVRRMIASMFNTVDPASVSRSSVSPSRPTPATRARAQERST